MAGVKFLSGALFQIWRQSLLKQIIQIRLSKWI